MLSELSYHLFENVNVTFPFEPLHSTLLSGAGGLAVSMLASGTQDRGFEPAEAVRFFG
jgi:hypothetical protein